MCFCSDTSASNSIHVFVSYRYLYMPSCILVHFVDSNCRVIFVQLLEHHVLSLFWLHLLCILALLCDLVGALLQAVLLLMDTGSRAQMPGMHI